MKYACHILLMQCHIVFDNLLNINGVALLYSLIRLLIRYFSFIFTLTLVTKIFLIIFLQNFSIQKKNINHLAFHVSSPIQSIDSPLLLQQQLVTLYSLQKSK